MLGMEPWLIVAGILLIQPLIGLLWAYALYRTAVKMTTRTVSNAIDERVNNVLNQRNNDN